jgi:hypothetical protein
VSAIFVLLKVAHIVAVVIGFGPLFVYPLFMRRSGGDVNLLSGLRFVRSRVSEPAFIAVGPLGLLAASQHPDEVVSPSCGLYNGRCHAKLWSQR